MLLVDKLKHIPVILGSQSPRRQELLQRLDIDFTVEVQQAEEYIDPSLSAEEIVMAICFAKLAAFKSSDYNDKLVIVSDTLVADQAGLMIGKPLDAIDAKRVLEGLSGQKHLVYTAVAMAYQGKISHFVEVTEVWFEDLEGAEIDYYIKYYNPFDKAGSYGIQEWIGRIAVKKIIGSYENVMGLPTARLYKELKSFLA